VPMYHHFHRPTEEVGAFPAVLCPLPHAKVVPTNRGAESTEAGGEGRGGEERGAARFGVADDG